MGDPCGVGQEYVLTKANVLPCRAAPNIYVVQLRSWRDINGAALTDADT